MVVKSQWSNHQRVARMGRPRSAGGWVLRENPALMERISKMWIAEKDLNPKKSSAIAVKISRELANEGIKVGYQTIETYAKTGKLFMFPESARKVDESILESFRLITLKWQELFERLERKADEWENDPDTRQEFLQAIRELRTMLQTSMEHLGELGTSLHIENAQITQVINIQAELVNFLRDKKPEIEGDMIKFKSPELIDLLKRNIQPKEIEKEIPVAA